MTGLRHSIKELLVEYGADSEDAEYSKETDDGLPNGNDMTMTGPFPAL